jgi:hypothetical protein
MMSSVNHMGDASITNRLSDKCIDMQQVPQKLKKISMQPQHRVTTTNYGDRMQLKNDVQRHNNITAQCVTTFNPMHVSQVSGWTGA